MRRCKFDIKAGLNNAYAAILVDNESIAGLLNAHPQPAAIVLCIRPFLVVQKHQGRSLPQANTDSAKCTSCDCGQIKYSQLRAPFPSELPKARK